MINPLDMMGDSFSVLCPLREQAFFGLLKSDFKVWIPSRVSAAAAEPCMRAMKCLITMLRQCKYTNKELRTSLELLLLLLLRLLFFLSVLLLLLWLLSPWTPSLYRVLLESASVASLSAAL